MGLKFRRSIIALFCLMAIQVSGGLAESAEGKRLALFDLDLTDTSLEGEVGGARSDETSRLKLVSNALREEILARHRIELIELGAKADAIAQARPLLRCNGCALKIARELDADLLLIGEVYKVSNLIIDINLYVLDAETGKATQFVSTSIRNNTDESWLRGVRYLVRNRLKFD